MVKNRQENDEIFTDFILDHNNQGFMEEQEQRLDFTALMMLMEHDNHDGDLNQGITNTSTNHHNYILSTKFKCPQCNTNYRVYFPPESLFIKFYDWFSGFVVDRALVPYSALAGASWVFLMASVGFGVHCVVTLTGNQRDPMVRFLLVQKNWSLPVWVGLACSPWICWAVVGGSNTSDRPKALTNATNLARLAITGFVYRFLSSKRRSLNSAGLVSGGVFLFPSESSDSLLYNLVLLRSSMLFGAICIKQVYKGFLYWKMADFMLEGNSNRFVLSDGDGDHLNDDTTNANTDANDDHSISLFSGLKSLVMALVYPSISAYSGRVLKFAFYKLSAINWHQFGLSSLVKLVGGTGVNSTLSLKNSHSSSFNVVGVHDGFFWSVAGGLCFGFLKDLLVLFYKRQKRKQNQGMRILDYFD